MKNGVGDYGKHIRYDWIDQSAMEYEDYIVQARNDWVYTTDTLYTSIDIARTYTKRVRCLRFSRVKDIDLLRVITQKRIFMSLQIPLTLWMVAQIQVEIITGQSSI